jgi:transglutaminase-like putative cysteine protease
MASRAGRVAGFVLKHLLRAIWIATMILTPLFGFWLASSLAAYQNATQWLALLVGLLLFPILPVGWDLFFVWRRSKREDAGKPILTRIDRLVLRTLLVNGLFLGVTLYFAHATAFRAVAVRGDWMFDGYDGPIANTFRRGLLAFADKLDERRVTDDNRYGDSDKAPDPWEVKSKDEPEKPTTTPETPTGPADPSGWPMPVAVDPLVAEMPEAMQTSIDAVGSYLSSRFPDKKLRVKAIHDYVVQRLEYDYDALKLIEMGDYRNHPWPSQDAEDVFARKKAVCAGYSRLMVALGKAAGIEIMYVTGWIRDSQRRLALDETGQPDLEGVNHAWNAVKIDEHWYLIDATWNDPTGGTPTTTYLFTPPKLMTYDHLPEDPAWQLRADPITLGDFVRQPLLSPSIGEYGLALVSPTRSQTTVDGEAEIVLENPRAAKISAVARLGGEKSGNDTRCKVSTANGQSRIKCALASGEWDVQMFAAHSADAHGRYRLDYVGSILFNSH